MKCVLCKLVKKKPKLFYEDKYISIIENINPGNYKRKLLCIWKKHKKKLTDVELLFFLDAVHYIRNGLNKIYKDIGWWDLVWSMKSQPQHFHLHLGYIPLK